MNFTNSVEMRDLAEYISGGTSACIKLAHIKSLIFLAKVAWERSTSQKTYAWAARLLSNSSLLS